MNPPIPMAIFGGDSTSLIEQIKEQEKLWVDLGSSVANYLRKIAPHCAEEADEIGRVIQRFGTVGTERQIERLKSIPQYQPPQPIDILVNLTETRDNLIQQIDSVRGSVQEMKDNDQHAHAGMMEATMLAPMLQQLAGVEESISRIQEKMEGTGTAEE